MLPAEIQIAMTGERQRYAEGYKHLSGDHTNLLTSAIAAQNL